VSARETHVTEWELGFCAGLLDSAACEAVGLRWLTVACSGDDSVAMDAITFEVPTCPRCAVLRDEALEGKLPKRKDAA